MKTPRRCRERRLERALGCGPWLLRGASTGQACDTTRSSHRCPELAGTPAPRRPPWKQRAPLPEVPEQRVRLRGKGRASPAPEGVPPLTGSCRRRSACSPAASRGTGPAPARGWTPPSSAQHAGGPLRRGPEFKLDPRNRRRRRRRGKRGRDAGAGLRAGRGPHPASAGLGLRGAPAEGRLWPRAPDEGVSASGGLRPRAPDEGSRLQGAPAARRGAGGLRTAKGAAPAGGVPGGCPGVPRGSRPRRTRSGRGRTAGRGLLFLTAEAGVSGRPGGGGRGAPRRQVTERPLYPRPSARAALGAA